MATRFTIESVFKAIDNISAPVAKMQQKINGMTKGINGNLKSVNNVLGGLVSKIGSVARTAVNVGVVGIGAMATATTLFLREFSKIEDAEASFTPLLGGAEKAKQLVEALNKTAATTPFEFTNLADTANQLLPVMNGNIENTIKSIRMLGDTSGGNAEKLKSITAGYTKAMLKGKVDLESLNMIGEAGVPIFQELAKTMNTKVGEKFFDMISDGKIKTKDLTKTFENMTAKGGIFYGGMEIASKTLSGVWSSLKDDVSMAATEIGSILAPTIKTLITDSSSMAQKTREWIKANKELITDKFLKFVDSIKSAFSRLVQGIQDLDSKYSIVDRLIEGFNMLFNTIAFLSEHGKTIAMLGGAILALSVVLNTFIGIMTAVNLIMAMSPIGLLITGIGLLVGAFTVLMVYIDDVEKYFDGLGETAQNILAPIRLLIDALQQVKEWGGKALESLGLIESPKIDIPKDFNNLGNVHTQVPYIQQPDLKDIKLPEVKSFEDFMQNQNNQSKQLQVLPNATSQENNPMFTSHNPQIITPQDKISKQIQETTNNSNSNVEVTIKDETGKAQITKNESGNKVKLQSTGAF